MTGPLVALTGATGFIGRHLLSELPKRGYASACCCGARPSCRRRRAAPSSAISPAPQNMSAALAGVDAVIHSAGIAHAMSGVPEDDYRALNTEATVGLARAAERAGAKPLRVPVLHPGAERTDGERRCSPKRMRRSRPMPTGDPSSTRSAALPALGIDWVALRPVLVYGPGVKGNMAALRRLARSPYPLPLGGLPAKRSLLGLDNLAAAIDTVLARPSALRRPLIVADPEPLTVADMIAAMREGLGRRPGVFPVPAALMEAAFRAMGRSEAFARLAGSLVASPAALRQLGWVPPAETRAGLAALARNPGGDG